MRSRPRGRSRSVDRGPTGRALSREIHALLRKQQVLRDADAVELDKDRAVVGGRTATVGRGLGTTIVLTGSSKGTTDGIASILCAFRDDCGRRDTPRHTSDI